MQGTYRGFAIGARQEKTLFGEDRTHLSAVRVGDGWVLLEEPQHPDADILLADYLTKIKVVVDTYWDNPLGYDDE